jgi:hypothetical protein
MGITNTVKKQEREESGMTTKQTSTKHGKSDGSRAVLHGSEVVTPMTIEVSPGPRSGVLKNLIRLARNTPVCDERVISHTLDLTVNTKSAVAKLSRLIDELQMAIRELGKRDLAGMQRLVGSFESRDQIFDEWFAIELLPTRRALEFRLAFDVTERFTDFLAAVRAGDVDRAIQIEREGHAVIPQIVG